MSVGYAYCCDGPDCEVHIDPVASSPPYLPYGFLGVRQTLPGDSLDLHFCGWDCLTKYAAAQPLPELIAEQRYDCRYNNATYAEPCDRCDGKCARVAA